MTEIKRGGVPWKKSVPTPASPDQIRAQTEANKARAARPRPTWTPLDASNAVAFRGNSMTGESIDSRKDLPPFGYNPPPKKILAKAARRRQIAPYFSRTPRTPKHRSATNLSAFANPKTRKAAMLQRLLNNSKLVQGRFERNTGLTVVRDARLDGTVTVYKTNEAVQSQQLGMSSSAMTSSGSGSQRQDFYDLLMQMEQAVLGQANTVWAAQNQAGAGQGGTFLGMPFGPGLDIFGGSDPNAILAGAVGGMSGVVGDTTAGSAGSVDTQVQKVALAVQRMAQIYQAIGNVFSKYHESANQAINNAKA